MYEQNRKKRKLRLEWYIPAFISEMDKADGVPKTIEELLTPETFASDSDQQAYWSVPERLLDIRWLLSRVGKVPETMEEQEDIFPAQFTECEFELHRIVKTLGSWASKYEKCLYKLNAGRFSTGNRQEKEFLVYKQFSELVKKVQRALPVLKLATTNMQLLKDQEYQESVWNAIQEVANSICKKLNGINYNATSIEDILREVRDAEKKLGLRGRTRKQLREYAKDKGRCVALLELDGIRVMSFSGFLDCEDAQVQSVLACVPNTDTLNAFREIAKAKNAELATFSTEVADNIMRYSLNSACKFSEYGPLKKELPAYSSNPSFLKERYSCCERKILASKSVRSKATPQKAIFHIKFRPCMNCYGALRKWINNTHVNLKLDCPKI